MHRGLGQHGVICPDNLRAVTRRWCARAPTFELALAQRRAVAGDDDELGLAGAEGLEGGFVAERDCGRRQLVVNMRVPSEINGPLPDFITSARRELMVSAAFLAFLVGAISAPQERDQLP